MIFARKIPEFFIIIARKIFFRILWKGARGPLTPVSYTPMASRLLLLCAKYRPRATVRVQRSLSYGWMLYE